MSKHYATTKATPEQKATANATVTYYNALLEAFKPDDGSQLAALVDALTMQYHEHLLRMMKGVGTP